MFQFNNKLWVAGGSWCYVSLCGRVLVCALTPAIVFLLTRRPPWPYGNRDKGLPNHGGRTRNNVQIRKYLGDTVRFELGMKIMFVRCLTRSEKRYLS